MPAVVKYKAVFNMVTWFVFEDILLSTDIIVYSIWKKTLMLKGLWAGVAEGMTEDDKLMASPTTGSQHLSEPGDGRWTGESSVL